MTPEERAWELAELERTAYALDILRGGGPEPLVPDDGQEARVIPLRAEFDGLEA